MPNEPVDPDQPVRVEAGTHRGRVVWFRVVQRWHVPGENDPTRRAGCRGRRSTRDWRSRLREFAVVPVRPARGRGTALAPATCAADGVILAGRSCSVPGCSSSLLVGAGNSTHPGSRRARLFVFGLGSALYWAALVGFSYLVLEPYVRRWWPETVISWNRLAVGVRPARWPGRIGRHPRGHVGRGRGATRPPGTGVDRSSRTNAVVGLVGAEHTCVRLLGGQLPHQSCVLVPFRVLLQPPVPFVAPPFSGGPRLPAPHSWRSTAGSCRTGTSRRTGRRRSSSSGNFSCLSRSSGSKCARGHCDVVRDEHPGFR